VRNVSERARLEQMKSDFIHRAAHDLRTPLTTASLAASIIQEGGTAEELEQYWKILRTELGRQRELIEELLTMGRLESGTFHLTMTPVEVAPLLQEALESVRPLAEKRGITFTCLIAADLPPVIADKNGLKQVFVNLLDNAVKFSPPGQTVELAAAGKADGASVSVRDHGIGIPAEDLPNLFARFFRASNAIRNEVQGTGVGLFIAKAVVDQLNGHISVDSQVNEGTTFEVWLPRRTEG
jgi:signal transduction histidine kinase